MHLFIHSRNFRKPNQRIPVKRTIELEKRFEATTCIYIYMYIRVALFN
jgi:hypothetical protein